MSDWIEDLSEDGRDFTLTHVPCSGHLSGGAETQELAQIMIANNKSGHTCSV